MEDQKMKDCSYHSFSLFQLYMQKNGRKQIQVMKRKYSYPIIIHLKSLQRSLSTNKKKKVIKIYG
jgi:hypothetical protein